MSQRMKQNTDEVQSRLTDARASSPHSVSIDWYHEGEARTVEVDGVRVVVRFVGRRGRRGRIRITAPPGAVFCICSD